MNLRAHAKLELSGRLELAEATDSRLSPEAAALACRRRPPTAGGIVGRRRAAHCSEAAGKPLEVASPPVRRHLRARRVLAGRRRDAGKTLGGDELDDGLEGTVRDNPISKRWMANPGLKSGRRSASGIGPCGSQPPELG